MGKATKLYNKTKRKGLISAVTGGIMTIAGIVLLILPLATVSGVEEITRNIIFLLCGGISLIAGFCLLISGMTQWMIRPYAVVFTDEGLFDFTGRHKNGMFIEWNNIKDAHVYGKGDAAFIGIDLISLDIAYNSISAKEKREIGENISNNMPAVIIPQAEIAEPIGSVVKAILQVRLGTKAGENEEEKAEKVSTVKSAPAFTPDELDELNRTGDVKLSNFAKFDKTADNIPVSDADIKKSKAIESIVAEEKKAIFKEAEKTEEAKTVQEKEIPETASIDDLLSMLSIGEDK